MTDHNLSGSTSPKGRRNEVVAAQKERFGGMKFGSAFFGWLTATGMAALLTALASAIGVAIATSTSPDRITGQTLRTVGIVSVLAILAAVAGSQFNLLSNLNAFPRIPVNEGDLTTTGIVTLIIAAVIALIAAILGGKAGMNFHRRVDQATIDHQAGLDR